jgi:hypothetical protein
VADTALRINQEDIMKRTRVQNWLRCTVRVGLPALAGLGLMSSEGLALSGENLAVFDAVQQAGDPVTYAKDVAPLIQASCQVCHRPGSVAPMSLLDYEDVKIYAPLIKERVASRTMPPWHIDRTVGIREFQNDISLTDEEIQTIVGWVDAGAPLGDPADMPPPAEFPSFEDRWAYEEVFGRPPDVVVASEPFTVPANGMDQWPHLRTPVTGLTERRWIRAVEVKPADPQSRYVFHHGNPSLEQSDGRTGLVGSAVGKEGDIYPSDSGKLLEPGATVVFNMHLFPIDVDVDAVMQLGMWLYPLGEEPEFITRGEQLFRADAGYKVRTNDLVIPPNGTAMLQGIHVLKKPARIHSVRAHMHLRGKYQMIEALHADGRREVLSKINFEHGWHTTFIYEDHVAPLLPTGTALIVTSWFDNTVNNKHNPDPDQWVVFGKRTVDDMSHMWIGITHFDSEEDFEGLVREREMLLREREQQRIAQVEDGGQQ